MIPYTNARLTAITAVGNSEDYDVGAGSGADRWTGALDIYVSEELLEQLTDGRVDQVQRTRLEIPYTQGKLIVRGDRLTYTRDGREELAIAGTILRSKLLARVRILAEDR